MSSRAPFRRCSALAVLILAASAAHGAGVYTVASDDAGRFWFADADGKRFLSIGVNNVAEKHDFMPKPNSVYYDPIPTLFGGDFKKWQESSCTILRENGFNTIGAWSSARANDGTFLDTPILYAAGQEKLRMLEALRPGYEDTVRRNTREAMAKLTHPEKVLGVFLDNEMAWFGMSGWDDNPRHTILEEAFRLPADHAHHQLALQFLQSRHASPADFSKAWGIDVASWDAITMEILRSSREPAAMADRAAFLKRAADDFFEKTCRAVRTELPGVLILGTRFAGNAPDVVMQACGRHCDVVSFNNYRSAPTADVNLIARYWLHTKKPLMLTEYSWRGAENTSGNPNTQGAGSIVPTQKDRGERYKAFVTDTLSHPMIVGMHWFQFSDQSPQGRFDGENSNYGMVDIQHRPYPELLSRMKEANDAIVSIRSKSQVAYPTEMPGAKHVLFQPGQYPNRPPAVDLLATDTIAPLAAFNASDATISVNKADKGIAVSFSSGESWGCGISFFGPKSSALPGAKNTACDLDGYEFLVLEADIPKGVEFRLVLDESSVGAPDGVADPAATDDGESFSFPHEVSKGGPQTWRYGLATIEARGDWGNQNGARRVDLQSLKGPAIIFSSGYKDAKVALRSLRFEK